MPRRSHQEEAGEAPEPAVEQAPLTFRDRHYLARRLAGPAGETLHVVGGRITTSRPDLVAWLDEHPGFDREG